MRVGFQIVIGHCGECLLSAVTAASPWLVEGADRDRNRSHRDSHPQYGLECYDPTRRTIDRICPTTELDWYWLGREQSVTITVSREEVVSMLRRAANDAGLGLRGFYELGRADRLDDPSLRDMWLIWGDTLTEEDFRDVA